MNDFLYDAEALIRQKLGTLYETFKITEEGRGASGTIKCANCDKVVRFGACTHTWCVTIYCPNCGIDSI